MLKAGFKNWLQQTFADRVEFNYPLGRLTSLKVGGPAAAIVYPRSLDELQIGLQGATLEGVPVRVLGGGTNLLVADSGFTGLILYTPKLLKAIRVTILGGDEFELYAEAGVRVPGLISTCVEQGLSGFEFAAGIPGTVGGIIWMNAGTKAGETRQILKSFDVIDPQGRVGTLGVEDSDFIYRSCGLPTDMVVLAGRFRLRRGEPQAIADEVARVKSFRYNQPLTWPNCGSVFKNPPGDFAGRLIEGCNLKGERLGGAMVSESHGNFIINVGGATANDVLGLIERVQQRVQQKYGIVLQTEVERLP